MTHFLQILKARILFFVFLSFFIFSNNIISNEIGWNYLKEGGYYVFIRHALAPGNGDPVNFDLNKCSTQRNLSQEGIDQSIRLGEEFKNKDIPISRVLTSQWCRCKDTAFYAFNDYIEFPVLNSTYSSKFQKNQSDQISSLINYINNTDLKKNNEIFVTHYVIIGALTDYYPDSAEIVITDQNLNVLSTIKSEF
ncbi:MAG: histidine phosphatase family protein [Alphaproteobacteria bacterium]|nr:histidine phosphatase family protein [Alphaproteobacteria bacterium]